MFYKRIVIKIGSNVITGADGLPDLDRLAAITSQVAVGHGQIRN